MFTWGRGNSGQLGHGDNLNASLPKPLFFFDDDYVISQASAGWSHSAFVSGQLKMKMFCNFTKREIDLTCMCRFWFPFYMWEWLIWSAWSW